MSKLDDIIDRPMSFIEAQTGEDVRQGFKDEIKKLMLEIIGEPSNSHNCDEQCCDKCDLRIDLCRKVGQL